VEKIDRLIDKAIDSLGLRKRLQEVESIDLWPKIVGESIASRTTPKRVKGAKLWVEVRGSAWMNELVYRKPQLIVKINRVLGERVIEDIIFVNKEE